MNTRPLHWLLGLISLWLALGHAAAQQLQPVPALSAHVIDQTATLTQAQRQALETQLATLEREHGSQLVVLLVGSTQPEDIAVYAQRVGDTWKLGRRDVGDGLLIVVALQDRKVRIEVAKTLEGAIPDLLAKRIITEQITPAFKRGDYAGGLTQAVDRLAGLIAGEGLPAPPPVPTPQTSDTDLDPVPLLLLVGSVVLPLIGWWTNQALGRKLGVPLAGLVTAGVVGVATGNLPAALLVGGLMSLITLLVGSVSSSSFSSLGGSTGSTGGSWDFGGGSSSDSSSSSDSFSSGGGGDFGGGGASGDW